MKVMKEVESDGYQNKLYFSKIKEFFELVSYQEMEEEFSCSIDIELSDGNSHHYRSATELLDPSTPDNISTLSNQRIMSIYMVSYGDFKLIVKHSKFLSVSRTSGSKVGHFLHEEAIRILGLKTDNRLYSFVWSKTGVIVYAMVLLLAVVLDTPGWYWVSVLLGSWIVMFLSGYLRCNYIIMENQTDSFFRRNRDSIIISAVSVLFGFVLGVFSTDLLESVKSTLGN